MGESLGHHESNPEFPGSSSLLAPGILRQIAGGFFQPDRTSQPIPTYPVEEEPSGDCEDQWDNSGASRPISADSEEANGRSEDFLGPVWVRILKHKSCCLWSHCWWSRSQPHAQQAIPGLPPVLQFKRLRHVRGYLAQ